MDRKRSQFNIRRGEALGDRLVWRFPGADPEVARDLRRAGVTDIPQQITVGYYRQIPDAYNNWCFMPVTTPAAIAALSIETVQIRICDDLAILVREHQT